MIPYMAYLHGWFMQRKLKLLFIDHFLMPGSCFLKFNEVWPLYSNYLNSSLNQTVEEIVMEGCLYKPAWSKYEATLWIDASGSDAIFIERIIDIEFVLTVTVFDIRMLKVYLIKA